MTDGFILWMKSVNAQCNRAFGMDTDFYLMLIGVLISMME